MNNKVVGMIVVVLEVSFGSALEITVTVVMVRTDKVIIVLNIFLVCTRLNRYFSQVILTVTVKLKLQSKVQPFI